MDSDFVPAAGVGVLPLSVVKLGGSLLSRTGLAEALQTWQANQLPGRWVWIAGGGELADVIRSADRIHHLGEAAAHHLAIETMRVTAKLLAALLPEAHWAESIKTWQNRSLISKNTILDVSQFMRMEEPLLAGTRLPEHWDVTSDSIAARLAIVLRASECVLLKSALPTPANRSLTELSMVGYLDRFLPKLQLECPRLRLVDLFGGEECILNG